MYALEIKDLCKRYQDFALDRLTLVLPSGCIMGLVGENGAGKSTTIKLILDMIRRDSGSIFVFGKDNRKDLRLLKEDIGVVLDEVGIPTALTVKQVGKIMKRTFRNWDDALFADYLRKLEVPENKKFGELSRGNRMKLGIAIAMSHDAKLLLLDEATSGLDPVVRDEVLDMLSEFTRDENRSVLLSSHIVTDLEKICDYIAFLHKGKLMLCEEKDRLKEKYGIIHCTAEELRKIAPEAVIGKKETAYGVEAIAEKAYIPSGMQAGPVDIEQLFVFMARKGG